MLKIMAEWGLSIGLMVIGLIMIVLAWGWIGWFVGGVYFYFGFRGFLDDRKNAQVQREWEDR